MTLLVCLVLHQVPRRQPHQCKPDDNTISLATYTYAYKVSYCCIICTLYAILMCLLSSTILLNFSCYNLHNIEASCPNYKSHVVSFKLILLCSYFCCESAFSCGRHLLSYNDSYKYMFNARCCLEPTRSVAGCGLIAASLLIPTCIRSVLFIYTTIYTYPTTHIYLYLYTKINTLKYYTIIVLSIHTSLKILLNKYVEK